VNLGSIPSLPTILHRSPTRFEEGFLFLGKVVLRGCLARQERVSFKKQSYSGGSLSKEYLFDVLTPLGFRVHCTAAYWDFISTQKHPVMKNKLGDVTHTLEKPDEIRQSRQDPGVFLFYRADSARWIVAVAKADIVDGFLVTAYPTDSIKIGVGLWKR
jgi:hypothetical protein